MFRNTHRGQFLRSDPKGSLVCYRTWFVLYSKFTENDKYNETVLAPNQLNLKVHRISNIYLKASPSGVPFIMCSAQNSGAWTPFNRKSLIPWQISLKITGPNSNYYFKGFATHSQSIEASLKGEDENVPASAEARDGPAGEEQAQEPEEGPDGVTLQ